jgi:hypothetical protein
MKYICVQPASLYYAWQIEVMLYSFIKNKVQPQDIYIILAVQGNYKDSYFEQLQFRYPKVNFKFYQDDRPTTFYISSVRPYLLSKYFKENPELEKETIFYYDCDVVLTKPLEINHLIQDDVWYLSDTISYIGYEYIKSKGDDVLQKMLQIMDMKEEIIKENQHNSGGAQYLMKNVTSDFWYRVYTDCEQLFPQITHLNYIKKQQDPKHHELQIWCADMWAVLWGAWRLGIKTKIDKKLNFTWANSAIAEWGVNSLFHNAGVIDNQKQFFKGDYMHKLPYDSDLTLNPHYASVHYYELVKEVGKNINC